MTVSKRKGARQRSPRTGTAQVAGTVDAPRKGNGLWDPVPLEQAQ